MKPRIVDAIIDPDGTEHKVPVEGAQRVVSEKTARDCLTLMENVVTKGQAKLAQVNGYRVGGKTGTAEAPSEKGGYEGYATSFIGVAPIENPRFMVSITLQHPKGEVGTIGGTGQSPFLRMVRTAASLVRVPSTRWLITMRRYQSPQPSCGTSQDDK